MFKRIKQLYTSNLLIKVTSFNTLIVFVKLISGFVVSKVSAVYLGPSGYALVGNFKNILQGVLGITVTGFESGIIKYVSENKTNKAKVNTVIANVCVFNLLICCVLVLPIYFFSEIIAVYTLKDASFAYIFKYLAFLLPLISFSFLIIYIVNGLQKFKLLSTLVVISNIFNALTTFFLVYSYDLKGALFASLLAPVFSLVSILLFKEVRLLLFVAIRSFKKLSIKIIKGISVYLFMAIYSSVLISLVYLLIRNAIIEDVDLVNAGYWEAVNKISMFYMVFFSSLFTIYLLPKLSENKTLFGYKNIMYDYFKLVIPLALVMFVVLFFLRHFVVKVFLSYEFEAVSKYFYLQFIGDFFKIVAFSLAYQFHAKRMVVAYFVCDAFLYCGFYIFSIILINGYDLYGVYYAYLLSVLLYLFVVSVFVFIKNKKYLKSEI
ncbi:O-antigen translocase [Tamlana sp. 2_MG-2023]|uniref:O-antigen translocase n=1 Tax=unclassified Tamlana TaxID=2614803 RepID=UPI0026E13BD0|nr:MULTISPECIES: O-antigen translocase [unclassified Tamlana]MDO6760192.1 O-antigen translocase [Tamlana sp. 2_MG-2023]MDO6790110.1 O-antigen translocase [Tamlana sp. 1_MG-2023]